MVAVLAMVVASCGGTVAAQGPPEIEWGRDVCIECGMIIDDPRFASAYVTGEGGEWRTFDDLGGLLIHGRETGELDGAHVWVSDFETEEWVEADQAHFVPTRGVASPMGYGVLAFSGEDRAAAFAYGIDGEVVDWEAVLRLPLTASGPGTGEGMDMNETTER